MKKQILKEEKVRHDFKAVEFMRERRDEFSEVLKNNPSEFWQLLDKIRAEYKGKFHKNRKNAA